MNNKFPNRQSIRLDGYDYSYPGFYFITIVTRHRKHLYGEIINDEMRLNDAGVMVKKWYYELENKYSKIKCGEMIIMPNHIHCIIEITTGKKIPGTHVPIPGTHVPITDTHVPITGTHVPITGTHVPITGTHVPITGTHVPITGTHVGAPLRGRPIGDERGRPIGDERGRPIGDIVCWFKTMTTNEYIRMVKQNILPRFDKKLWQRNYWEHIVRDENEYHRISEYIKNNPLKWNNDKLNGGNGNIVMDTATDYNSETWMV